MANLVVEENEKRAFVWHLEGEGRVAFFCLRREGTKSFKGEERVSIKKKGFRLPLIGQPRALSGGLGVFLYASFLF